MSVGYQMEYQVKIRGSRESFEKIPAIVKKVPATYSKELKKAQKQDRDVWDCTAYYQETAASITAYAKEALATQEGPFLLSLEFKDDDVTHDLFEAFLSALDEQLPELEIAAYAIYYDTEYHEGDTENILYSPKGFRDLEMQTFDGRNGRMDTLPNEDWLPDEWRALATSPDLTKRDLKALETMEETGVLSPATAKRLWKTLRWDGALYLDKYRGSRPQETVPAAIGKTPVSILGVGAFARCHGLTQVTVSEGVTEIRHSAFRNCDALTTIMLPASIEKIYDRAFSGCAGLNSITIPEGVEELGPNIFQGCTSLACAVIPASVKKIAKTTFKDCPSLTIHAPAGSPAEKFAKEKKIKFEAI